VVGGTETLPRGGGDGIDGIEPMGERHEAAAESVSREIAVLCVCRVPCAVVGGYGSAAPPVGGRCQHSRSALHARAVVVG
jgi:hypothetical protein